MFSFLCIYIKKVSMYIFGAVYEKVWAPLFLNEEMETEITQVSLKAWHIWAASLSGSQLWAHEGIHAVSYICLNNECQAKAFKWKGFIGSVRLFPVTLVSLQCMWSSLHDSFAC